MDKEKYISCTECDDWDFDKRQEDVCRYCNNAQLRLNPILLLCNLCGGPMCPEPQPNRNEYVVPRGLYRSVICGAYDSPHLSDNISYEFNLCELCLRKLFAQCIIPPKMGGYGYSTYQEDQQDYEYAMSLKNGKHHQAYLDGKCNQIISCPNDAIYTIMYPKGEFTEQATCEDHKHRHYYEGEIDLVKFIPNVLKPFI